MIPYSGLFLWGAKFRFRGQPRSHEIFHQRISVTRACTAILHVYVCDQSQVGE